MNKTLQNLQYSSKKYPKVYRINIHSLFQNNKYYSRETLNTMEHLQNGDTLTIAIYHNRGNGVFLLRGSAWQQ